MKKKILNTIDNCSFDKLTELEKKQDFFEAAPSKKNNKKVKFFYLGEKNNWRNLLDPSIVNKTEKAFSDVMKELKYI